MNTYIAKLQDSVRKRIAYYRTVDELSNLPREVALDLDIYQGDVRRIAHEAVYGK